MEWTRAQAVARIAHALLTAHAHCHVRACALRVERELCSLASQRVWTKLTLTPQSLESRASTRARSMVHQSYKPGSGSLLIKRVLEMNKTS